MSCSFCAWTIDRCPAVSEMQCLEQVYCVNISLSKIEKWLRKCKEIVDFRPGL